MCLFFRLFAQIPETFFGTNPVDFFRLYQIHLICENAMLRKESGMERNYDDEETFGGFARFRNGVSPHAASGNRAVWPVLFVGTS